jgi:hypothetical protein
VSSAKFFHGRKSLGCDKQSRAVLGRPMWYTYLVFQEQDSVCSFSEVFSIVFECTVTRRRDQLLPRPRRPGQARMGANADPVRLGTVMHGFGP